MECNSFIPHSYSNILLISVPDIPGIFHIQAKLDWIILLQATQLYQLVPLYILLPIILNLQLCLPFLGLTLNGL